MSRIRISILPCGPSLVCASFRNAGTSSPVLMTKFSPGTCLLMKCHARPTSPRSGFIGCFVPGAIGRTLKSLSFLVVPSVTFFALNKMYGVFNPHFCRRPTKLLHPRCLYCHLQRAMISFSDPCCRFSAGDAPRILFVRSFSSGNFSSCSLSASLGESQRILFLVRKLSQELCYTTLDSSTTVLHCSCQEVRFVVHQPAF